VPYGAGLAAESAAAASEVTDFGEAKFPIDPGRARLLPSRSFRQFRGPAGTSPSWINNLPQMQLPQRVFDATPI